jgi:hypothetical protein
MELLFTQFSLVSYNSPPPDTYKYFPSSLLFTPHMYTIFVLTVSLYLLRLIRQEDSRRYAVAQLADWHCATNREVAGSIHDDVIEILY